MALSPTSSSGGAVIQTHAYYSGPSTAVANLTGGDLPLGAFHLGDDLLTLTSPAAPVVIAAGVYSVTAITQPSIAMTVGGLYSFTMDFDANGDDQSLGITYEATTANPQPGALLVFTYYVPAAGVLRFNVFNLDGVKSLSFGLTTYIQRLS